jgi:2-methylisocitrate lyase-like PEP mutase family enzyme
LRERLGRKPILLVPGVHDGLTAAIAAQAGAEAIYLSGAAQAYARHGRPDIGLVSMSEVAETVALIRDRVDLPMIVDADTGFGNALNMARTVRVFERAGASALQIEDQTFPKRCGHLAGKTVIPMAEMVGKIHAALDARDEALIIARSDALATEPFEAVLERAHAYAEAGADALFLDALRSREQMEAAAKALDRPLMANMVEGGMTPMFSAAELEAMGFALVIFPAGVVRTQALAARDYYAELMAKGSSEGMRGRMLDFDGLNELIGTPEMLALGKTYE